MLDMKLVLHKSKDAAATLSGLGTKLIGSMLSATDYWEVSWIRWWGGQLPNGL